MSHLTGKKIAFLVHDNFEEVELTSPRDALVEAGAEVSIIAPKGGTVQGMNHIEPSETFMVDTTFKKALAEEYDGVVVPGGVINSDFLRVDTDAQFLLNSFDQAGKPIAVICHGPWLLISSGIAKGRTLTSYHTLKDDLKNAGANWVDEPVVVDGNLITSRNPDDLPKFNSALLKAIK